DIWDRKPIGLFLIYAAVRLLGGGGVWQYQIVAVAYVIATAMILFAMARRVAGPKGGLGAALLYVLYLVVAGGEGGQAPVFYNLPVAAAVAIVFFARDGLAARRGDMRWPGVAAMALFGLAMQIKYSVVFEGLFVGLTLIALSWREGRRSIALLIDIILWVGCALLPTALAAGAYAATGHLPEWLYANVTSIAERRPELPATTIMRVQVMAMVMVPLAITVPLRRWVGATPTEPAVKADLRFLDGWAAAALIGVILFGTWFNHYALPLFAPFAVAAAMLCTRRWGRVYFMVLLVGCGAWGQHILYRHQITRGDETVLAGATAAARDHRNCVFVYDGMPALYYTTNSCLPSTRPFPAHLQSLNERGATGIDQPSEVRRIMAGLPDRVMTMEPAYDEENLIARGEVYRVLRQHYAELYRYAGGSHQFVVYGLKGTLPAGR
ncbi:MAG: rane protein, partial [Sphingomonas bacterium]|nr:rane protein [Sphingomonas bacterium]